MAKNKETAVQVTAEPEVVELVAEVVPEPVEVAGPPTLAQTNTEKLIARGARVLSDDEVIDRGDYVVWKDYDPARSVLMVTPQETIRLLGELPLESRQDSPYRYVSHATKPLRLDNVMVTDGDAFIRYYTEPTSGMVPEQCWVRIPHDGHYRSGNRERSVISHNSYLGLATTAQMSKKQRRGLMQWLLDRLTNDHSMFVRRQRDMLGSIYANPRSEWDTTMEMRGGVVQKNQYVRLRALLREAGEQIAQAINGEPDVDQFFDTVESLDSMGLIHLYGYRLVDRWNEHNSFDRLTIAECGHLSHEDDTHTTYDGEVCESCFEDHYSYAQDTGEYHRTSRLYEHDNGDMYTYPEEDEDEDESAGGYVKNYTYNVTYDYGPDTKIKPTPYGEFLMGIELEVMPRSGERREAARHTHESLCEGYAVLKNDGSLGSRREWADGFEIVTAPRGLAEHIRRFKAWEPHDELSSWDTGKCGMHVHISSQAFTAVTLGKFIEFINARDNSSMIKRIAGRVPESDNNASEYCEREGHVHKGNPKATLDGKSLSRYYMVNTGNLSIEENTRLQLHEDNAQKGINTIELRIFKGTLSKPRLLAQIEFAHAAVMFCRWTSMRELDEAHFLTWLRKSAGSYPNLSKWFGVRANKKEVDPAPKVRETADV